jgi:hypothetical protein
VSSGESGTDLATDAERVEAERAGGALDARRQRLALEILHDDVGGAVGHLAVVEATDHPRMRDDVHGARFVKEPRDDVLVFRELGL